MANHIINNIADHYACEHYTMERWDEIKNAAVEYGNELFYIFDYYVSKKTLWF